jgi:hypothetical protein
MVEPITREELASSFGPRESNPWSEIMGCADASKAELRLKATRALLRLCGLGVQGNACRVTPA